MCGKLQWAAGSYSVIFLFLSKVCNATAEKGGSQNQRRSERTEPNREYLTTAILLLLRAKIAMTSSVALPQVAFSSPPTTKPDT